MENEKLVDKVLDKIKEEKIAPKPRWYFLLKNNVVIASGVLALIFGALGMSVIIYLLKYNNWEFGLKINNIFGFILMTLPYFWIVFFVLFVFIIYYNIKHSKRGYKYPIGVIITFALLASIILGEVFFLVGFGEKMDQVLGKRAPLYKEMFNPQLGFWLNPEEGRLAGMIFFEDDGHIYLMNNPGEAWSILVDDDVDIAKEIVSGTPVHILGDLLSDGIFKAELIREAKPGRAFMTRPGKDFLFESDCSGGNCDRPVPIPGHKVRPGM